EVRLQRTDVERVMEIGRERAREPQRPAPSRPPRTTPVRRALQILLEKPALAATVGDLDSIRDAPVPGVALLATVVDFLTSHPHYHTGAVIEHWRDEEAGKYLAKLASQPLPIPEEGMETELRDAL